MKGEKVNRSHLFVLILCILGICIIGTGIYILWVKHHVSSFSPSQPYVSSPTPTQPVISKLSPVSGWKVYTSITEQASFRYPDNWSIVPALMPTDSYNKDDISLQSPDKQVTVNWVPLVQGLGGGCGPTGVPPSQGGCPYFILIDKALIPGVSGLSVVSGIITIDDKYYTPFLAVQDVQQGLIQSGSTMGYEIYPGRHNGGSDVVFATSGIYAFKNSTKMSKTEAEAWFTKLSVQQAKQILMSLTY